MRFPPLGDIEISCVCVCVSSIVRLPVNHFLTKAFTAYFRALLSKNESDGIDVYGKMTTSLSIYSLSVMFIEVHFEKKMFSRKDSTPLQQWQQRRNTIIELLYIIYRQFWSVEETTKRFFWWTGNTRNENVTDASNPKEQSGNHLLIEVNSTLFSTEASMKPRGTFWNGTFDLCSRSRDKTCFCL